MRGICGVEDKLSLAANLSPNKLFPNQPTSCFRLNTIEIIFSFGAKMESYGTYISTNSGW